MNLELLRDILFLVAGVFGGITFILVVWLYRKLSRPGQNQDFNPVHSATELAILFQTMRSLVHDQKTLAQDFNRSVDQKVTLIRQVMKQVLDEHARLREQQRALARELERIREEHGWPRPPAPAAPPAPLAEEAPPGPAPEGLPPDDSPNEEPPAEPFLLHAIARPGEQSPSGLIDHWAGLDFANEAEPQAPDAAAAPVSREEEAAARRAFQDLLQLRPAEPSGAGATGPAGDASATVRARVYRYHDAGMSVSAIADELGIGKGEIRLMLSLRDRAHEA